MPRRKIGVLISGGGTNLQAVIDACRDNKINAEIKVVISNKKDAFGLKRAEKAGIDSLFIDPKIYPKESFDLEVIKELGKRDVEWVVLAGFLRVLSPIFIDSYRNKIVNIHPSLIPKFCGEGFYGEKVHKAVLEAKSKCSGATVHFVDEGTDTGQIILQESIDLLEDETLESLQKKVLEIEHKILVRALYEICREDKKQEVVMKRALISVYDKTGIIEFSKGLIELGWDIISTGGTYKLLRENSIQVLEIDEVTNFPEILDGRVKTLNPYIHGGILFKREEKSHREKIEELGIVGIDMVVNNLYPFEETIHKDKSTEEEIIENIDIGGPSMIRAAAKNFKDVIVLVDPKDYNKVLVELQTKGEIDIDTKKAFAKKVFNYTAYYDSLIAQYFNEEISGDFPELLTIPYKKKAQLRYGENPHQKACFYVEHNQIEGTIAGMKQLHGKELSYNNINDANGAITLLKEFTRPTAVAVKHVNPCGVGSGDNIEDAFKKAYECDTQSIFGGIVALNREVTIGLAETLKEIFLEIIIAPSFSKEALEILTSKKNIRLLEIDHISEWNYKRPSIKQVDGGLLVQDKNMDLFIEDLNIVTDEFPDQAEMDDMIFAWKVAKHISSNGVVIAKDNATLGIGLGEVNRFWAVEEAIQRAGEKVNGAVLASDGFFPFKDSIEAIAKSGISCIIQPGGSIKDQEVVQEANKSKIKMVFTDIRHFRH